MATIIKTGAAVRFPRVTLTGDLEHDAQQRSLVLHTEEGPEVLSIYTGAESPLPWCDEQIHIKDYSEHSGLAQSLEEAGVLRTVSSYTVGPFESRIVIAELV